MSSKYLLILEPNGNLKGAYTYADPPDIYDSISRNLILWYESPTYTAMVQTRQPSNNGYKLFSFTFTSSSSTPTFLWAFKSF
jgi:hypothetical protein